MVACAGVVIDAEPVAHDALAVFLALFSKGLYAALLVQHAFRLGDDDLRAAFSRWSALPQGVAHLRDVIGARRSCETHFHADATDRPLDRIAGRADLVLSAVDESRS